MQAKGESEPKEVEVPMWSVVAPFFVSTELVCVRRKEGLMNTN